jgi:hypothetical protein
VDASTSAAPPREAGQEADVPRDARHFVIVRYLGGQSYLTVTLDALRAR